MRPAKVLSSAGVHATTTTPAPVLLYPLTRQYLSGAQNLSNVFYIPSFIPPFFPPACRSLCAAAAAEKLPEDKVVTIGDFRIGLIHGHQIAPFGEVDALAAVRRRLDCDVLIHGFSPQSSITEYGSHAYVCPGSVTGAFLPGVPLTSAGAASTATTPSFMLLNVMAGKIEFFKYELGVGDKLKISRSMFMKGSAPGASAPATAAAAFQKV